MKQLVKVKCYNRNILKRYYEDNGYRKIYNTNPSKHRFVSKSTTNIRRLDCIIEERVKSCPRSHK